MTDQPRHHYASRVKLRDVNRVRVGLFPSLRPRLRSNRQALSIGRKGQLRRAIRDLANLMRLRFQLPRRLPAHPLRLKPRHIDSRNRVAPLGLAKADHILPILLLCLFFLLRQRCLRRDKNCPRITRPRKSVYSLIHISQLERLATRGSHHKHLLLFLYFVMVRPSLPVLAPVSPTLFLLPALPFRLLIPLARAVRQKCDPLSIR